MAWLFFPILYVSSLNVSHFVVMPHKNNITKAHAMQAILESLMSKGDIRSCRLSDRPQELPSGNSQDSKPLRFGTAELCSGTAKPSTGGFQGIDKVWLMVGASR